MDKKSFRKEALNKRNQLPWPYCKEAGSLIGQKLWTLLEAKNVQKLMVYVAFGKEVDVQDYVQKAMEQGIEIYVPRIQMETKQMVPTRILDFSKDLIVSKLGVKEPRPNPAAEILKKSLDGVIVPGVAFDEKGYRLGFGGGFYDRFLPLLKEDAKIIALSYEAQMYEEVPIDAFDVKMPCILTEKRILKPQ